MADESLKAVMSVVVTTASKLTDLAIKNGQLIFINDNKRIALDFNDKRVFYNQIVVLQTESERTGLLAPIQELFYFVVETAILWTYQTTGWIQVTKNPSEIVYIGDDLPEVGITKNIYINKAEKNISIWDEETSGYIKVSDCADPIDTEEITSLFNN